MVALRALSRWSTLPFGFGKPTNRGEPPYGAITSVLVNGSERVNILLIEDHQDTQAGLSLLLQSWGHRIVPTGTAKDALEFLTHARFDIFLCDLGLPDGDGLDLVRKAKQLQPEIRAIALTARGTATAHRDGYMAGFDHYLVKPPNFDQLRALLS